MPPIPSITVTIDTTRLTYTFSTANPSIDPETQFLPVPKAGQFSIVAGGSNSNITVVATVPQTAIVTQPFDRTMDPVTTSPASYEINAIGMVTLTVPTYGSPPQNLTGTPLVISPEVDLTLTEEGNTTPAISYGATVNLIIEGLSIQTNVTTQINGLFIGENGNTVPVDPGGSPYEVEDVDENNYTVQKASQSKTLVPLIGVINVSSTKKPRPAA